MQNIRIGLILGLRQIQRANIWTTLLIIFVMMLTFLNLIVVSGILVGLIAGAENAVKEESLGDIVISPLDGEDRILETEKIASELETYPEVSSFAVRHQASGVLEANYQERRNLSKERDIANVTVTGIEPIRENEMSNLADNVVAGEYLQPDEEGYILIGYYYLQENADLFGDIFYQFIDPKKRIFIFYLMTSLVIAFLWLLFTILLVLTLHHWLAVIP